MDWIFIQFLTVLTILAHNRSDFLLAYTEKLALAAT